MKNGNKIKLIASSQSNTNVINIYHNKDIKDLPIKRPKISERKTLMSTLVLKTRNFIEKFYAGL